MEFGEVVASRRMVRAFEPGRSVPADVRDRLLHNANRAPSAGGTQGWGFLVLETPADRELFWDMTSGDPPGGADAVAARRARWLQRMREAPLLVVVWSSQDLYRERYAEPDKGWERDEDGRWSAPYWHVDAGFAALLMLLTAVDEGLGACFFGIPPERVQPLRDGFGVPPAWVPVGVVAAGYPGADPRAPRAPRRGLGDVVHHGRW